MCYGCLECIWMSLVVVSEFLSSFVVSVFGVFLLLVSVFGVLLL